MPAKPKTGKLWAVIMAGGSGTRFWPASRRKLPKQFLRIFGKKSLLEQTIDRLIPLVPASRILVVTQRDKVSLIKKILKSIPRRNIIGEPVGRNTAPCAVLAAAHMARQDPDAVLALLPADHLIKKPDRFRALLRRATQIAAREKLPVTFGVKPSFAHPGYGYLELDRRIRSQSTSSVFKLKRFHEKPQLQKARSFLRKGRFLWNSGMFVWRADALLEASKRYLPDVYRTAQKILSGNFSAQMKRHFKDMRDISIDYGLMEKMRGRILTLIADIGWNDVGGWTSLEELIPKDQHRNIALGTTVSVESAGNIVKANDKLVALVGVRDHIVIDTPDALLICSKSQTEKIREVVKQLKNNKRWFRYL